MKTHRAAAALITLGTALAALPSAADVPSDALPAFETKVTVVDIDALPRGELPALPAEKDAPTAVPTWTQPATVSVNFLAEMETSKRARKPGLRGPQLSLNKAKSPKRKPSPKRKLVGIEPVSRTMDAMYSPSPETLEQEAAPEQKMTCGDQSPVVPLRWEKLTTAVIGDAHLDVRDLWFDAKACAVGPGTDATILLKPIAWDGGKPWLFAMRSATGVTLVMPHTTELSSESMVGAPVSVRGDFTRITMPLGRWGSGSIVAQLDSLTGHSGEENDDRPVEVGIEIVQTMSEKAPTLLVRTRRAKAEVPQESAARD